MATSAYRYRALEGKSWIRVFHLLSAQSYDDRIVGRITHLDRAELPIPLRSKSDKGTESRSDEDNKSSAEDEENDDGAENCYEAVSYTWGDPVLSENLVVLPDESTSGVALPEQTGETHLAITRNVDTMLRFFRSPTKIVRLWVDAICLNQVDKHELGHQIALMGEIYNHAPQTRIWLGPEDEDVAKVFTFLKEYDTEDISDMKRLLTNLFGSGSTEPLTRFFDRPWFSRRWVVQELALSRTAVFYAHHSSARYVTLRDGIENSVDGLFMVDDTDTVSPHTQCAITTMASVTKKDMNLLDRLYFNDALQCREHRDHILAFHGICSHDPFWDAQVQRTGSDSWMYELSWQSLFKDVIRFHLETSPPYGNYLAMLATMGSLAELDEDEVSWCPSFHRPRKPGTFLWMEFCDPAQSTYIRPYTPTRDIGHVFDESREKLLMRQRAVKIRFRLPRMAAPLDEESDSRVVVNRLLQQVPYMSPHKLIVALFDLLNITETFKNENSLDRVLLAAWFGNWPFWNNQDDGERNRAIDKGLSDAFFDVFALALTKYTLILTEPYAETTPEGSSERHWFGVGICDHTINPLPIENTSLILVGERLDQYPEDPVQLCYIRTLTTSEETKFSTYLSDVQIDRMRDNGWAWNKEAAYMGRMGGAMTMYFFDYEPEEGDSATEVPKYDFVIV